MPPHPKRKLSRGRRDRRRAHDTLAVVPLVACGNCAALIPPHTVCPKCGYYGGRQVFEPKKKKAKKE